MTKLTWDGTGEKVFEAGVDHGVLYLPDPGTGEYDLVAAPWNGLTTVTESPSGAESNKQYADNQVYLNLQSAEEYGGTIEAFTYPDEFGVCDGTASPEPGIYIGQQGRKAFGLAYRTLIGNDTQGTDFGYKLNLVWGALASPSEKAHTTLNDSPEATPFSWEFSTTPINVGDGSEFKPTASMVIDSRTADADVLADLEDILFGTPGADARLPGPAEILTMFGESALTEVNLATPANQPTYNAGTHVVTLPAVTGIQWKIGGVNKTAGAQPALGVGQTANITAHPTAGYTLSDESDSDWSYAY